MRQGLLILVFSFLFQVVAAQEISPVQNFGIHDYGAGSQNWSITQDQKKHVFIGNNNGLLEFNGAFWSFYPSPNGTIIRAVHEKDDLIYSGSYMDFGYWKRNEMGQLDYFSISGSLPVPLIDDEHFWNITSRDEWVLFQSLNRIYLYNTKSDRYEVVDLKIPRAKIFNLKNKIYIQKGSGGLYSVQNGKVVLESDHTIFNDNLIVGLFEQKGKLLILTESGSFYFLDQGQLSKWEIDDLNLSPDSLIYCSLKLSDGSFMLGSVSDGYIRLSAEGKVMERINQENGLANNTVLTAFEDADNNLWLGLNNGISIVNLDSPFKVFEDRKGEIGSVYETLVTDDMFYLGTNQGLYAKNRNTDEDFQLLKGTAGQVWFLSMIGNDIFCGHTNGTFLVKGKKAEHIYMGSGTWEVKEFPEKENMLIQGHYNGLSSLIKKNGVWEFDKKIKGFNISSKSFAFSDTKKLIVNHEFKGLYILDLDPTFTEVENITVIEKKGYDTQVFEYQGHILYDSNEGVFRLDEENVRLEKDSLLTSFFYDDKNATSGRLVLEKENERLWGFSPRNIIYVTPDSFDGSLEKNEIAIPRFFRQNQGLTGYENISSSSDGDYILGTSTGYSIFNLNNKVDREFIIRISSVQQKFQNSENRFLSMNNRQEFGHKENSLVARINIPSYEKYAEVAYQYQLLGLYDDWSKWSSDSEISLENLPFGSYTLNVRGRVGNKLTNNIASYSFKILKPWYFSNVAVIIYAFLFGFLMFIVNRIFVRYYRNQRNRLIEENKKELELSQLENKQEIITLRNEQLKSELDGKNRELAITAMSLINKNELLLGIKKDLLLLQNDSSKEDVIKVIDTNLKNNNDWDFFKEAFNNADKDFLKKIKSLHPDLTANDLKFCAFLRLNLSSKEIAPLLNISVRSVEIKRYRLRKKLNLEHADNLVDYILEV